MSSDAGRSLLYQFKATDIHLKGPLSWLFASDAVGKLIEITLEYDFDSLLKPFFPPCS